MTAYRALRRLDRVVLDRCESRNFLRIAKYASDSSQNGMCELFLRTWSSDFGSCCCIAIAQLVVSSSCMPVMMSVGTVIRCISGRRFQSFREPTQQNSFGPHMVP